jgi:hypothetical protein
MDIHENYLSVSTTSTSGGVYIFDISTPREPVQIEFKRGLGYVYKVKFYDGELYVASREQGVMRFGIRD